MAAAVEVLATSATDVDQSAGHRDRAPHTTAHHRLPARPGKHSDHGESEQAGADSLQQSALGH